MLSFGFELTSLSRGVCAYDNRFLNVLKLTIIVFQIELLVDESALNVAILASSLQHQLLHCRSEQQAQDCIGSSCCNIISSSSS
jgi:hypothetical protein